MGHIDGILYSASVVLVCLYLGMALRRSEFGLILLTYEAPFFLGCCVYPLLFGAGVISAGIEGRAALSTIGIPGTLTAIHVFSLASGTLLGYLIGRAALGASVRKWQRFAEFLVPDTLLAWRVLIIAGLVVIIAFMMIVGIETALLNAALARSGVFEGFEEDLEWLFLKRLASIFGLVFVFVPAVLMLKKERTFFFVGYFAFVALLYFNSISRVLLIRNLVLPMMIYLYMSGKLFRPQAMLLLPIIGLFVAFVVVYGKGLGTLAGALFSDGAFFELTEYQSDAGIFGVFEALLRNMEGQWYSIAAGIKHFAQNGPLVPADVVAALIGFIPNRVLEWLGFGAYHYSRVEPRLACINTAILGLDGCFLPPFNAGYSAYFVPVLGGFVFAFVKTWLFGWLESMWNTFRARSVGLLWMPFLGVHMVALVFVFIPVNISIVVFVTLAIGAYAILKRAKRAFRHGNAPSQTLSLS